MALYTDRLRERAVDAARGAAQGAARGAATGWVPEQHDGAKDPAHGRVDEAGAPDRDDAGDGGAAPVPTLSDVPIVAAAASGQLPSLLWGGASIALFLGCLGGAVAVFQQGGGPAFVPPDGLGVFALFYVVAQAAERLVALLLGAMHKLPGLDKPAAQTARDHAVAAAAGAPLLVALTEAQRRAQDAADAQAEVEQVRSNRAAVAFSLTASIAMLVCGYVDADFLSAVGVDFGDRWARIDEVLTMAVTGLVVGGGSKQLNDLIGTISKKNAEKSTPPQTGGRAGAI